MYRQAHPHDMDRSLDEFLDQSDTNPDQDVSAPHESRTAEAKTEIETETKAEMASGARSTMVWSADGAVCETCSDVVQRRWRDDDQLVCNACKEW